jgi:hypothetical protein
MERYLKLGKVPREQFLVALGCSLWDGERHSCTALSVDKVKELVGIVGLTGLGWEDMNWNQKVICFGLARYSEGIPNGVDHIMPKGNRMVCKGFENGMYPACEKWQSRGGSNNEVLVQFGGLDEETGAINVAKVPHTDYLRFRSRAGGFDLADYLWYLRNLPSLE